MVMMGLGTRGALDKEGGRLAWVGEVDDTGGRLDELRWKRRSGEVEWMGWMEQGVSDGVGHLGRCCGLSVCQPWD